MLFAVYVAARSNTRSAKGQCLNAACERRKRMGAGRSAHCRRRGAAGRAEPARRRRTPRAPERRFRGTPDARASRTLPKPSNPARREPMTNRCSRSSMRWSSQGTGESSRPAPTTRRGRRSRLTGPRRGPPKRRWGSRCRFRLTTDSPAGIRRFDAATRRPSARADPPPGRKSRADRNGSGRWRRRSLRCCRRPFRDCAEPPRGYRDRG